MMKATGQQDDSRNGCSSCFSLVELRPRSKSRSQSPIRSADSFGSA